MRSYRENLRGKKIKKKKKVFSLCLETALTENSHTRVRGFQKCDLIAILHYMDSYMLGNAL